MELVVRRRTMMPGTASSHKSGTPHRAWGDTTRFTPRAFRLLGSRSKVTPSKRLPHSNAGLLLNFSKRPAKTLIKERRRFWRVAPYGDNMKRSSALVIATALSLSTVIAAADDGQRLSRDELQQILPDADVSITFANGDNDRWTNAQDGTLVANWQNGVATSSKHYAAVGHGNWKISDDGLFCVHIQWMRSVTDWCRTVVRSGEDSYTLASTNGEPGWQMKVSRK
jgi:hypothetical protein